jgi:3-oxoadipate enol-lactonase
MISSEFKTGADDGTVLDGSIEGEGRPVLLLHGLTSARRYVLMGSKLLVKSGFKTVAYDARGHGTSQPAVSAAAYNYEQLSSDLSCVLNSAGLSRPMGIGVSMGAHTLAAAAAANPTLFSSLVLITPAYLPGMNFEPETRAKWHALAEGLRMSGPEGFIAAGAVAGVDDRWRDLAIRATLQRMALHRHPDAVADALDSVPQSVPFDDWEQLSHLEIPIAVVGSRDNADPGHPLAVAKEWSERLPNAKLFVEEEDASPLAWRGAAISKIAIEVDPGSES